MRLCIPTIDDTGPESRLSDHFGRAPFFMLVDSESGVMETVRNSHGEHESGNCHSVDALQGREIGAVICHGLGRRGLGRLLDLGLPVFVTEQQSLAGAVNEYRAGRLRRLSAEETCLGGGHGGCGS